MVQIPRKAWYSQKMNILIDLDGTLAYYKHGQRGIGEPIPAMLERVHAWIEDGYEIRLFTARSSVPELEREVREWLDSHGLDKVVISNLKDFGTAMVIDDIAREVVPNTGMFVTQVIDKRRVK